MILRLLVSLLWHQKLNSVLTILVSTRHRVSPYPLISLEQALDLISQEVRPLPAQRCRVRRRNQLDKYGY